MSNNPKQRLTLTDLKEPQQIRELNRQLTWIWDQLLGGLSMKSLNAETKETIDSKADGAVVEEIKETADQASKDANAASGAVFEMQGDVEQAKQDSAQAKADAGEAKEKADTAEKAVVSMQTSIEQNEEAIRLKADKTTVDTLSGKVSEHSAQFEVTAEQISSTVERVDTLDGKVEEQSTRITQTAEKIESKAEKAVVDELGNAVSRHESAITQTPEQIRMAVESVQVGGRNLLRNTATLKKANYSFNNSSDASAGIGFGSTAEDEYGGFHVVCKNQNVRIEMGTFPVTPGQTYAMSVRYKINSGSAPIQFQYIFRNASANALHYWDSVNHSQVGTRVEDGWTVMSSVFTVPDNAAITMMQLAIRTGKDNTAYTCDYNIRRPQLETGNKATDWSPAPEDTDAAIDELSASLVVQAGKITANTTKIETVNQAAGNAQSKADANAADLTAVTKRVTTAEVNISALDGEISSKVSQTDFNALGNRVSSAESAITQQAGKISANATAVQTAQNTADAAKTQAETNKNSLSSVTTRVTTAEANISALDGKISTKVEKADFDALGNKVSANTSAITQTAEAIRSEVASSVSGLQTQIEQTDEQVLILAGRTVGGTNLIRCSEGTIWVKTGGVDYDWKKSKSCQSGVAAMMLAWSGTHNEVDYESNIDLEPGIYTLSFWSWYASLNVTVKIRPNILGSGYDKYFDQYAFTPNPGVPKRYSFQLEIDYTGRAKFRFVTMTPWPVGEVYFTDVKLEKGNTATDWSPSPDDPASSVMAGSGVLITKDKIKLAAPETEIAIPAADGERTVAKFDADGLTAERVQAGNVSYRYDGPAALYVNPNATSAQIAAGNYFKSLTDACVYLSYKILYGSVSITVQGDSYGVAELHCIGGGGRIDINGGGHKLIGSLYLYDCAPRVYVNSLTVSRPSNGAKTYAGAVTNCNFIAMNSVVLDGNGGAYALIIEYGARLWMENVELYNATHLLYALYGTDVTSRGLRGGGGTNFAWANGCILKMEGTRPDGEFIRSNAAMTYPDDPGALPIDYGTAQPSVPVISTASWSYLYSDSYAGKWGIPNQDAAQGVIRTDSSGTTAAVYGTIWFDAAAIRSALSGKTIRQVSLRLTMLKGYGRDTTVSVQLCGTNAAYSGRSGQPQLVTSYGTIGATEPGAVSEITIPTAVISDIVNGTIQALVLKSDDSELYKDRDYSKNYARFAGSATADGSTCPRLTVVYQ